MGSIFTIFTILRFYRTFIIFSTRIISSSKPSRVATFACDSIYTGPHSTPQSPLTSTSTIHNHRHIRSLQVSFTLSLSLTWCWWPDARHSLHCRLQCRLQAAGREGNVLFGGGPEREEVTRCSRWGGGRSTISRYRLYHRTPVLPIYPLQVSNSKADNSSL